MKKYVLSTAVMLFLGAAVSAQSVNKDSIYLVNKISVDKERLAKLEATLPDVTKVKEETAKQAQESADDNRKAANRLSNDPQDRKLARKADNEASDARSDAKKARKAQDKFESLQKDIRNLNERIAKEETKLKKYVVPTEEHQQ